LYGLVRDDKPLGEIAETQISSDTLTERQAAQDDRMDWLDLQAICNALLRDTHEASFRDRLERLQRQLVRHTQRNPDGTLFALIYLSSTELRMYSATHAMLVSVMCMLAAKDVLELAGTGAVLGRHGCADHELQHDGHAGQACSATGTA